MRTPGRRQARRQVGYCCEVDASGRKKVPTDHVAGRSDAGRRRFRVRADRRCTPTVGQRPPITTRTSVVATPTGLEPATSAVTGRADGRWRWLVVTGALEFTGLRSFETLGSRRVFSGLVLPRCCPTEIIFSRDRVEPRPARCGGVDAGSSTGPRRAGGRRSPMSSGRASRAPQARRRGAPPPQPVLRSRRAPRGDTAAPPGWFAVEACPTSGPVVVEGTVGAGACSH